MSIGVIFAGFLTMLLLMFLSMPVAVSILSVGAVGGYLAYGMPLVETMGGVVWGTLNNPVMTAIPLFMLLGELLLRGGIADRMFDALAVWLGRLPGGLLHTNIGTCRSFRRPPAPRSPPPPRWARSRCRPSATIRCGHRSAPSRQVAPWAS